jgi:hypothetical protein
VVVLVMENKSYTEAMGARSSTYLRSLARRYAAPASLFATRHPSLPNYLALTGGDTFGVTSNCTSCHVRRTSLADQLDAARYTWKAYMEGMPKRCFKGATHGGYAKKHDPFMYYDAIRGSGARCARVVPYRELGNDLRRSRLPDFAFITPDLCNSTHDCSVGTGDRFLAHLVPALLRELGPHGILFLTWDEGSSNRGCCGVPGGGRIATVVAGPDVARGARGAGQYTHYSILRTVEDAFGLPRLRHARDRRTVGLDALFKRSTRGALRHPGR